MHMPAQLRGMMFLLLVIGLSNSVPRALLECYTLKIGNKKCYSSRNATAVET